MWLIFDLMDTVVRDPFFSVVLPRVDLAQLQKAREPNAWLRFERGELDEAGFANAFYRDRLDGLPTPEQLAEQIKSNYAYVPGMEDLLQDLSHHQVGVLSNYPEWFEVVRSELNLDRFFQQYCVSYQIGARKPETAAFAALAKQLGADYRDVVFVDDRVDNVDAACALGIDGILFTDPQQLRLELARRNVL